MKIDFVEAKYLKYLTPRKLDKPLPIFKKLGLFDRDGLSNHLLNLNNSMKYVFLYDTERGILYQLVTGVYYIKHNSILFHRFGITPLEEKPIAYDPRTFHKSPLQLYIKDKQGKFHPLNYKTSPRPKMIDVPLYSLSKTVEIIIKEVNGIPKSVGLDTKTPDQFLINTVFFENKLIKDSTRYINP